MSDEAHHIDEPMRRRMEAAMTQKEDSAFNSAPPPTLPPSQTERFKRIIENIPTREPEDPIAAIATSAAKAANGNSEARRDAVCAVALAIKRRGDNPVSGWTAKDVDTAWAIADMLIALG